MENKTTDTTDKNVPINTDATAEVKVEAAPQTPSEAELQSEIVKLKDALSRANSSAAEWKRALREKQTEQERAEAERAEREKAREARLAELEAKERVNTYADKLTTAGYDPAVAKQMAASLPEGVGDEYFAAQKSFIESQRMAMQTAALKNQPGLSVGMPPTAADAQKEEMNRMRKAFGLPLK